MTIREEIENREELFLSQYAVLSKKSKGRKDFEENCSMRTSFQRDRDRIIHSKSFRRLKHKTQVFIAPEGDHFRTRLTHTLEVAQISRTIARALRLNEDLVEAIALGHDLGHTPFGHTGENVLDELHPNGFKHNEQSLRIVERLEHNSKRLGLNLTWEVREGILNHSGENESETLEGQVVRHADRIAYINHDIDDSIRGDIIKKTDIPDEYLDVLGYSHGERINKMIEDIVLNSQNRSKIKMSDEIKNATKLLREYMFENVYENSKAKDQDGKAEYILEKLYNYYIKTGLLPKEHIKMYNKKTDDKEDIVCDYIAGMTDRFALNTFKELFIPESWSRY